LIMMFTFCLGDGVVFCFWFVVGVVVVVEEEMGDPNPDRVGGKRGGVFWVCLSQGWKHLGDMLCRRGLWGFF
jgi:hypothetical protein